MFKALLHVQALLHESQDAQLHTAAQSGLRGARPT